MIAKVRFYRITYFVNFHIICCILEFCDHLSSAKETNISTIFSTIISIVFFCYISKVFSIIEFFLYLFVSFFIFNQNMTCFYFFFHMVIIFFIFFVCNFFAFSKGGLLK